MRMNSKALLCLTNRHPHACLTCLVAGSRLPRRLLTHSSTPWPPCSAAQLVQRQQPRSEIEEDEEEMVWLFWGHVGMERRAVPHFVPIHRQGRPCCTCAFR